MISYAAAGRTPPLGAAATIVGLRSDAQKRGAAGRATEVCEKPRGFLLNFNAFVWASSTWGLGPVEIGMAEINSPKSPHAHVERARGTFP